MSMHCKICSSEVNVAFSSCVLNKYKVTYFKCNNCGYIFTENPYWLDEAYKNPINLSDTGIMFRNIRNSKICSNILFYFFSKNIKSIDYAGGFGVFTRLMRDIGYNFYWYDPYTVNLVAKGFEYNETKEKVEFLTAFEVFEHFVNPICELEKMRVLCDNILFTTELIPEPIPDAYKWWYYGQEHGQHVSFYSSETLKFIANNFGFYYYSCNSNFHLFTKKRINTAFLKLITGRFSLLFFYFSKRFVVSKIWEDHLYQKKAHESTI